MPVPVPTPLYRFVQIDNLPTLLQRGGLHSPRATPNDGLPYTTIFGRSEQDARAAISVPCGPGGTLHDYVPFYFGPLSPMMLRLHTGRVDGYEGGQKALVYCTTTAERIVAAGLNYVFSDGHGLAALSEWFDDVARLDAVDWDMVGQRYWRDTDEDPDRQRRKQAEFLVHTFCPWDVITALVVIDELVAARVKAMLESQPASARKRVLIRRDWYY